MAILKDLIGNTAEEVLDNLGDIGDKYIALEKIIPAVNDMLTDQASEMRKLNKELGNGSKTTASLRGDFAKLSKELGIGTREIYEFVSQTKEYHQSVKANTSITLQFLKASGASFNVLGKFAAKLNILGVVSKESLTTMYEDILSVREAYGLTDAQIDSIVDSLEKYAVVTGATDEQLKSATVTLSKFTSQLTSAGIEADKVKEIIDGMLDPDKMTNNLVLMSKIGVSISDMVSGDPVAKLEGSADKLKQLGQEISNIAKTNRIQANEVAKVYGLTLEQANMLANMDTSEKALNTQKKLDEYRNEMESFTGSIKSATTMIAGAISGPLSIVGRIFEKLGTTLTLLPRGLTNLIIGITGKKILGWISDKLGDAARGWGKNMGEAMAEYMSQVEERSKQKKEDSKNLSSLEKARENMDYGWGLNYNLKAEEKRTTINKKRGKGRGSELTSGEMIEDFQTQLKAINDLKKQRALMADDSKEAKAFNDTYGTRIQDFENKFDTLIKTIGSKDFGAWSNGKQYTSEEYKKLSDSDKYTASLQAQDALTSAGVKDVAKLGIGDNSDVAQIAALSEGPKEFLEKLMEFWAASDDPSAAEHLKEAKEALEQYNDATVESLKATGNFKEAIKSANEVMNDSKKGVGLGNRIGSAFSGMFTNLGSMVLKVFNPAGIAKMIGGALLGGAFALFSKAISRNEKFQKAREEMSEKFNAMFDGLVASIEPIIEPLTNLIDGIITKIQPAIDGISSLLGKLANWFGGKISNSVQSIQKSVSTIEDTYKQEDLKTMVGGAAVFNSETNELLAKLDDIYYKVVDVTKKQDVAAEAAVAGYISGGAK